MSSQMCVRTTGIVALLAVMISGCALGRTSSATPESLVGTWSLEQTFDSPEQPFVSFVRDRSWSASDGCNRAAGEWALEEDGTITVTSGPQTRLACDGAELPVAVTEAERMEVRGDTLVIHGSRDAVVTELVRSRDPFVGPQSRPVGYWVEDDSAGAPFLFLSSRGSFSGNDGCNTLTGPWEATDDGGIRFPATVSTEMFCEGVDAWLGEAVLGRAISGVMSLYSKDGEVIGQLRARR